MFTPIGAIRRRKGAQRPPTPAWIKLALLLLVVFGIVFSNWLRKKERSDVRLVAEEVVDYTSAYIDVYFLVNNTSSIDYTDLPVMIRVYASDAMNDEVTSLLTTIDVKAGESVRMGRRLDKLARPLADDERPFAVVEIHQHDTIF